MERAAKCIESSQVYREGSQVYRERFASAAGDQGSRRRSGSAAWLGGRSGDGKSGQATVTTYASDKGSIDNADAHLQQNVMMMMMMVLMLMLMD